MNAQIIFIGLKGLILLLGIMLIPPFWTIFKINYLNGAPMPGDGSERIEEQRPVDRAKRNKAWKRIAVIVLACLVLSFIAEQFRLPVT